MAGVLVGAALASNYTLYHVNPKNYSSQGIAEMDTGDALGDFFFAGRSVCSPIECAEDPHQHDCTNPEVTSGDLTVTKVIVDLGDPADWGVYARCNIGPPYAPPGEYKCTCGGYPGHGGQPCTGQVGNEQVAVHFGAEGVRPGSPNFDYWRHNLAIKTNGQWYSTPAAGEGKYWKLIKTVKQVNKTCADDVIFGGIASKNPGCFSGCPQPTNRTSNCFIGCYYDTVIGPQSGSTIISNTSLPVGPTILTREEMQALYDEPFLKCPPV